MWSGRITWLSFLKILNYVPKERKIYCKKWALICHSYMLRWLIGIILGEIICESSNWQHIQRLKITVLGANWQLFRLERIAKCSCFILSTQNIKFYWFVMKIKKFMLPIWWYNRGWFPLGNKYLGSSFWMGEQEKNMNRMVKFDENWTKNKEVTKFLVSQIFTFCGTFIWMQICEVIAPQFSIHFVQKIDQNPTLQLLWEWNL